MIGFTVSNHPDILPRWPCLLANIDSTYSLRPLEVYIPESKNFQYNSCFRWSKKSYLLRQVEVQSYDVKDLSEMIRDYLLSQYLRLPGDKNIYLYRDIHKIQPSHLLYRVKQLNRETMEWEHSSKPISSIHPLELQEVSEADMGCIIIANLSLED